MVDVKLLFEISNSTLACQVELFISLFTFPPSFPAAPGRPCSPGGPGEPGCPRSPLGPTSPVGPCQEKKQQDVFWSQRAVKCRSTLPPRRDTRAAVTPVR